MAEAVTKVTNKTGIHARPASDFVKFVNQFTDTKIFIIKDDKKVDAKSILNILSTGLKCGTEITVQTQGENEDEVLNKIIEYIENMKD